MQIIRYTGQAEGDVETESDTGFLPDQLINPREYKPVLPTTEEHTAAEPTVRKGAINEEARRLTPVYTYGCLSVAILIIKCYAVSQL